MNTIIDCHTHIFPDSLAPKAIGKLGGNSGIIPCTDGTLSGNEAVMKRAGVGRFVSLNIATKPNQEPKVNEFAVASDGCCCVSFGSVNPFSDDLEKSLAALSNAGIKGIKLHPEYQRFHVLCEQALRLYDMLRDFDFIVTFHAGWDVAFPDSSNADPKSLARLTESYPDLRFVFAHMGGMKRWDDVLKYLAGCDCFFDTAMCAGYLETDLFLKILEKHGENRVLFGSDCPWQNPVDTLKWLKKANLDEETLDKILYKNANILLRL